MDIMFVLCFWEMNINKLINEKNNVVVVIILRVKYLIKYFVIYFYLKFVVEGM